MRTLILLISFSSFLAAQQTYQSSNETTHFTGPVSLAELQTGIFGDWFTAPAPIAIGAPTETPVVRPDYVERLKETRVKIYFGTWCGDSRQWLPRFIEHWKQLGLDTSQLELIALYNGGERHKTGPNHEEAGQHIVRVPTFIFERNGVEIGRIIESPVTDLETDVAQMAYGYPTQTRYAAADALWEILDTADIAAIQANPTPLARELQDLSRKSSELNTLGYLYLRDGDTDRALIALGINAALYPYTPNVYDSLAEGFVAAGETAAAIEAYRKVLALNPQAEGVPERIEELEEK